MDKIEFEENIYYEQMENPDVFEVTVTGNPAAEKCKLEGVYDLHINTESLAIVDKSQNKRLYTWPYRYIRRYGKSSTNFQFEAGRKCQSGEGLFSLLTKEGDSEKVFNLVQIKFNAMKKRDREFHGHSSPSGDGSKKPPMLHVRQYENSSLDSPTAELASPSSTKPKPPLAPKPSIKKPTVDGGEKISSTEPVPKSASQINDMLMRESRDMLSEEDAETDGLYSVIGVSVVRDDTAQYSDVYSRPSVQVAYGGSEDTYDEVQIN